MEKPGSSALPDDPRFQARPTPQGARALHIRSAVRLGPSLNVTSGRHHKPPLDGLRRQLRRGRAPRAGQPSDPFLRETFTLPREEARTKAREWFERFPKAAYWTQVESWRLLPGGEVEFTMRRLPTAD